jgi:hypothetical protein
LAPIIEIRSGLANSTIFAGVPEMDDKDYGFPDFVSDLVLADD